MSEIGYAVNQTSLVSIALARIRAGVGVAPHRRLTRQRAAEHVGVFEHRLPHEPLDVRGVRADRGARVGGVAAQTAAAQLVARAQPARPRGIPLLVVADLARDGLGRFLGLDGLRGVDGRGHRIHLDSGALVDRGGLVSGGGHAGRPDSAIATRPD